MKPNVFIGGGLAGLRRLLCGLLLRLVRCRSLLQVEVDRCGIAVLGLHVGHLVHELAIHGASDVVLAVGQAGVDEVPLFVRFGFVMALHVGSVEGDDGALEGLTIRAFDIAFGHCRLGPGTAGQQKETEKKKRTSQLGGHTVWLS